MKKKILTFILLSILSNILKAQPWHKNTPVNPTFFDLQKQFYDYWKNNENPGGAGYNVFKRWEWFWEQRVSSTGEFPAMDNNQTEWNKYVQKKLKRAADPVWRCLGPFNTPSGYNGMGRVNCVAFHPTDKNTFWVGTPAGGLWKTSDFGKTWSTSTDKNPVLGVSSIAIHPLKPDTMYIATGDGDRGSLSGMTNAPKGDSKSIGVLKSSNGGTTWNSTGLNWGIFQAKLIRKLILNPKKPWVLLCAASDGIYRTSNAGATWNLVTAGYFMDMAFKPDNPDVIYATTFAIGTGNAKVYRSLDGGVSFSVVQTIANGMRIAIGVTKANSKKVHLLVAHKDYGQLEGIYESLDSGNNFSLKYNERNLLANNFDGSGTKGQGWYDLSYNMVPDNENIIFLGGTNTWKSTDGGDSFVLNNMWTSYSGYNPDNVPTVHADKHHFITHPLDNSIVFDCNDGGIYFSNDMGVSWNDISENLAITQFYRIAITDSDTGIVLGGAQDNGARILNGKIWGEATGGDGMEVAIDPKDPMVMYSSYAYGRLYRNDFGFQNFGTVTISDNIPYRPEGAWVTPFVIDPNISSTIYAGYKVIYKSTDYGDSWSPISDSMAAPNYLRIIAVAPGNSDIIYTTDFYNVYRTVNGGLTWKKIIISSNNISNITVSPFNPMIIYYTISSISSGNKVFKFDGTITQGNATTNLSGNLPNVSVNCINYYKGKSEALYIGTDVGVFYRDSSLNDWISLNGNMPNTVVTDIEINDVFKKLVVGTYGRGIWQTDLYGVEYPKVISLLPLNNSISVSQNTPLKINFDVTVQKGKGTVKVYENNILKRSYAVDSSAVNIGSNTVTINHGMVFAYNSNIEVWVSSGAFRDMSGNNALGIGNGQWSFTIETFSGLKGVSNVNGLKFYPNPASNHLVFEFDCEMIGNSYEIADISGKIIQQEALNGTRKEVDIQRLQSGIYFVKIKIAGSEQVFKLIVNNK